MRAMDWSKTELGPPSGWPQCLRTALQICLNSAFPIALFWGERFVYLYNDEYRATLGRKHPALGKPAAEVWPEAWPIIGPTLEGVRRTGEATRERDRLIPLARDGTDEIAPYFFSYSYSPVIDEEGRIAGIFNPVIETTETLKAQRRLQDEGGRLKDLFAQAPGFMAVVEGPEHRYALANRSYEDLFGSRELVGRSVREAYPELVGQGVFERLDRVWATGVAETAEGLRVMLRHPGTTRPIERFVDIVYQPIRASDGKVSGIFLQGVDTTEHALHARRDARLAELESVARTLTDAQAIAQNAARLLAGYLGADRCAYAVVDADQDRFDIIGNHTAVLSSATGSYRMSDFSVAAREHMLRGEPWVVDDCEHDARLSELERQAYRDIQMRGVICVPLSRGGRFLACMAVHSRAARAWNGEEISLVVAVADRCWESIERSRIEAELRSNEARFRSLVHGSSQIIWTADANGYVGASPSWSAFTGQTAEETIGDGWLDMVHPEDRRRLNAVWRDGVSRGSFIETEYRLRDRERAWRWVRVNVIPVRDGERRILEWVGMITDVTQRKLGERRDAFLLRMDDAVRASSDPEEIAYTSMRMLCEEMEADRATYFEADPERQFGRVVRDYAPGIVGMQGDHAFRDYGALFADAMHANQPIVLNDAREAGLTTEERARFDAIQIGAAVVVPLHKDGTLAALLGIYQGRARQWTAGEVDLVRVVVDRCWESMARARVSRELQAADRRKDEFIATLAHELRNPLAPLRNSLAVLTRNAPGISTERLYAMMERQVDHLVRMVDDLLDVSRITRGKVEIRRERLDLVEVVRNAIDTSRPWLDAARHHFELRVPSDPVMVEGDPVRLTQVFANLVNNAAKYTPPGGHIQVQVWIESGRAQVRVTDDGVGIAPEMRSRVFEIFAQVPEGQHRTGDGLGIGLSLVKSLVALHDGTVGVRSEGLGKGSRFQVSLPLAASSTASGIGMAAADVSTHGELRRVLVVDDNRDAADSIAMVLATLGADVRVAYDGAQALELAESYRPAIGLLDIGMPEMDGLELARRLRRQAHGASMTLVALTGWGQDDDQRRSLEAGFDRHLIKPIGFEALQEILLSG